MPNKRTFDLIVGVSVGLIAVTTGFRLWAGKELAQPSNPGGVKYHVAEVIKAVTG